MSRVATIAGYLWAGPWTLVAAGLAPLVVLSGGEARWRAGLLELAGGQLVARLFPRLGPGIVAITLGHAVVALDHAHLEATRAHERVHVDQYRRYGPLFPLLYGMASLAAAARGGHYYRDNRFEREARDAENRRPPDPSRQTRLSQ